MSSISDHIKHFIVHDIMFKESDLELGNDDSLLEKGIIDSTGIIQLVSFLEKEFNVKIENKDLLPENFETINSISGLVQRRNEK